MNLSLINGMSGQRERTRREMMTFRTFEIDAGHITSPSGTPALTDDVTSPVRNIRSRRNALARSHRTSGTRLVGFGF